MAVSPKVAHALLVILGIHNRLIRIEQKVDMMNERESAAWAEFNTDLNTLVEGYTASRVENAALRDQVAQLSQNQQDKVNAAVAEALEADSNHDAELIENANAVIENGLTVPPLPAVPDRAPDALPTDTAAPVEEAPAQEPVGTGEPTLPTSNDDGASTAGGTESDDAGRHSQG